MAGFRLTNGTSGCPPTENPPADYKIPFRFDDAGRLWITSCFKGFRYFGAARHDIGTTYQLGINPCPVSGTDDIISGDGVTAGTYTTLTITNDTNCDLGVLLANDIFVDWRTSTANMVRWVLSERWNGANHAISAVASPTLSPGTAALRQALSGSANPHDVGLEASGVPTLTLAPGVSAQVGARLFLQYQVGAPNGDEFVYSAYSAVRAYGYVI